MNTAVTSPVPSDSSASSASFPSIGRTVIRRITPAIFTGCRERRVGDPDGPRDRVGPGRGLLGEARLVALVQPLEEPADERPSSRA